MQKSNIKNQNLKKEPRSFHFWVLFLVFTLCTLILTPGVNAQTAQVFTAIPPRLEIQAKPGQFVQKTIQFRNEGDTVASLTVVAKDFIVNNTLGTPEFVSSLVSGRWSAASWVRVTPSSLAVAPKSVADIIVSVNVPLDALPGGHYAGVLYESSGTVTRVGKGTGAGSAVQQVVGTLVYLTVEGKVTEGALIKQFKAPGFLEFGPVNFTSEILNQSDVHVAPQGQILVRDMLGRTAEILPLEERNIFPGASFIYKNTWESKYLLGRYRADLTATYGSHGRTVLATIYFIVFPVKVVLAIILVILLVWLVIVYLRRRRQEKENEEIENEANEPSREVKERPKEK